MRPAIRRRHARVPVAARNPPQDLVERGNPGKARLRLPANWRGVAAPDQSPKGDLVEIAMNQYFLSDAADAIGRKPNKNQALVVSLAGAAARRKNVK